MLENDIVTAFKENISKKSEFIGCLSKVYKVFRISVTINIRDNILKFLNFMNMEEPKPDKLFIFVNNITK